MKPIINYTGVQSSYNVNVPISTLVPTNTGGNVSQKLRIVTVSGNSNSIEYPKDGTSNESTYKFPLSVAYKSDGSLAVIDEWSQTIRIINSNGVSSTLAGKYELINGQIQTGYADGQGTEARFNTPHGIAFDNDGNIIVADTYNFRIRKVTPQGLVTTIAGSGVSGYSDGVGTQAQFKLPMSLWVDNTNNIFVTDNFRVRKITPNGVVTTVAGNVIKGNINGNGASALFKCMRGITGDNLGNLFVSDTDNSSVRRIDSTGNVINLVNQINAIGIVYFQGMLYVADYLTNEIKSITRSGVTVKVYVGSGIGQFKDGFDTRDVKGAALYTPHGLAIANNREIYIADKNSMKIRKTGLANYFISPSLPTGLSLNPITGVISGIPTQTTPSVIYNITAANSEGYGTTTIGFKIN